MKVQSALPPLLTLGLTDARRQAGSADRAERSGNPSPSPAGRAPCCRPLARGPSGLQQQMQHAATSCWAMTRDAPSPGI
eukprot:11219180-Alexandrium_andersonii.AAC.1